MSWSLWFCFLLTLFSSDISVLWAHPNLQEWEKSVGQVTCRSGRKGSRGTGFLVDNKGHIATNHHVIALCLPFSIGKSLNVSFSSSESSSATIVKYDARKDLAILKISPPSRPILRLFGTFQMAKGERLWSIGFPGAANLAIGHRSLNPTVTTGTVSRLSRDRRNRRVIQTDTPINPGNSGGPLLDGCGRVVGISTFGARRAEGIKFAVSTVELLPMLHSLQIHSTVVNSPCRPKPNLQGGSQAILWFLTLGCLVLLILLIFRKREMIVERLTRVQYKPRRTFEVPKQQHLEQHKDEWILLGLTGEYTGSSIPLRRETLTFGRDASVCHLVFPAHDTDISKRHAELKVDESHLVWVRDCWSSQGTYLNGRKMTSGQWTPWPKGQELWLGKQHTSFRLDSKARS